MFLVFRVIEAFKTRFAFFEGPLRTPEPLAAGRLVPLEVAFSEGPLRGPGLCTARRSLPLGTTGSSSIPAPSSLSEGRGDSSAASLQGLEGASWSASESGLGERTTGDEGGGISACPEFAGSTAGEVVRNDSSTDSSRGASV